MEGAVIAQKDSPKKRKPRKPSNRIVISEVARARVDQWSKQIESEFPGFQVAKADLVSWMICNRLENLSDQEMSIVRDEFFDRARCIRTALKELTLAQRRGDDERTSELIKSYAFLFGNETEKRPKKSLQKKIKTTQNGLENNESNNINLIEKHKE